MNITRCFLLTILEGFPCATCTTIAGFNDKWQTCLRDSKTLKVVLCTKFFPACDKQVIASALVQFHLYFQSFPNCPRRFATQQFCENFLNTREINPQLPLGPCDYNHIQIVATSLSSVPRQLSSSLAKIQSNVKSSELETNHTCD